ncbi:MAG: hypothetical protein M3Y08_00025 [Fibrobacterota bacterium]|nr:hypothetical protein [Fibrobacterota bacterium]
MQIGFPLYLLLSLSCILPASAQYEDLVDFPDAPTRTKEEEGIICTIEGVQFTKKPGPTEGSKELSIVFLLTEKPSAYFNYYDPVKKAVVFDFYDTHIGESIMDPIHEHPITNSTVELFKLDLNKDVAGLRPDIRDVVRVSLFSVYDLEYDIQEDYGVITMNLKWNKKMENAFKRKSSAFYWQFPMALAFLGGAGYAGYYYLYKEPAERVDFLPTYPTHPKN